MININTVFFLYFHVFQKRVTLRRHNYFYKPIAGTPFSLGLALPEGYGMLEVNSELEIKHAIVNGKEKFLIPEIVIRNMSSNYWYF